MKKEYKILINYSLYLLTFLLIVIVGLTGVFAQVISYRFFGQSVNGTFGISSGSSSTANTYINVTADSTAKYLVVDLCSTVGTSITTNIPSDYDGSYTQFYKMYDLKSTCSTGSYNGSSIRIFYLINTWADSGNGNQAINNTTKITNNASYYGEFKLISVGLSDTIDLGDLTVNNQATIINGINGLNSSISSSQSSITNSITSSQSTITNSIQNSEDNIISSQEQTRDAIIQNDTDNTDRLIEDNKNTYQTCRDSINLFDYTKSDFYSHNVTITTENNTITMTTNSTTASNNLFFFVKIDDELLENGETYTISSENVSGIAQSLKLQLRNKDGSFASGKNQSNSIVYDDNYSLFVVGNIFSTIGSTSIPANTVAIIKNVQVEKGTVATDYEPYGEEICKNKLDEANETSKGILGKLKDLISYINPLSENFFVYKLIDLLLDLLKSLFIPDDFDFIYDFMDVLSNKLGFIASVPVKVIEFILDLPDVVFSEVNSLHFPKINIFGYYFWDDMEIDLSVGKSIFASIKYITDIVCVILCVNTLYKWYHTFTGGGAD